MFKCLLGLSALVLSGCTVGVDVEANCEVDAVVYVTVEENGGELAPLELDAFSATIEGEFETLIDVNTPIVSLHKGSFREGFYLLGEGETGLVFLNLVVPLNFIQDNEGEFEFDGESDFFALGGFGEERDSPWSREETTHKITLNIHNPSIHTLGFDYSVEFENGDVLSGSIYGPR